MKIPSEAELIEMERRARRISDEVEDPYHVTSGESREYLAELADETHSDLQALTALVRELKGASK